MRVRLINQNNPKRVLCISSETWSRILELAEEYGWRPLGTRRLGADLLPDDEQDGYLPPRAVAPRPRGEDEARLVLWEDALNLADALEWALREYEPEPVYKLERTALALLPGLDVRSRPSLGAIHAVLDFCRFGEFRIERA